MDSVKVFNAELSALYESKPPVSRAKMAQLTKSAIKAIKFYKHVVQSVEKFIMKCRPEYKVPGLYVIDSIVRQSRHQFSIEKDMFAPRFTKNITVTFQHLYKCPAEDKSKIVRVLNLWQKNSVFPSEVIQPLMDLAPDPTNPAAMERVQEAVNAALGARVAAKQVSQQQQQEQPGVIDQKSEDEIPAQVDGSSHQNDVLKTVTQLLQQSQDAQSLNDQNQQLQQLQLLQQQLVLQTQLLQQPDQEEQPVIDSNLLTQIQQLTAQLLNKSQEDDDEQPAFNKKLLDFDYGESDEEETSNRMSPDAQNSTQIAMDTIQPNSDLLHQRMAFGIQQSTIDMINQNPPIQEMPPVIMQPDNDLNPVEEGEIPDTNENELEDSRRDRRRHRRSRSRSRTRNRKSRSRSRDRRRSRSRDRDRYRKSRDRDRDREREREKQRDKERERKKMGLPPMKADHVSICSTTLWIGHLNKHTTEDDLNEALSKYCEVVNMALVPPRGCAYVTLSKRRDAARALDRMKGAKLLGNTLKAAWAMGAGVRESSLKEKWDMDLGVTYIPYDSLDELQLDKTAEGAVIDEESLPEMLRKEREQQQELLDSQTDVKEIPPDIMQQQGLPSVSAAVPGMMPMMPLGGMPPMISMPPLGVPPPAIRTILPGQLVPGLIPRGPPTIMTTRLPPTSTALHIPGNQVISSSGETSIEAEAKLGVPPDAAGISLQQAIQNIVNNSASITAVAESGPGPATVIHQLPVHAVHPHNLGPPPLARLQVPPGMPNQIPVPSNSVGIRLLGQPGKLPDATDSTPTIPNGPQPGIRLSLPIQGGNNMPPSLLGRDPIRGPTTTIRMELQNRPPLMSNSPQRPMVLLNQRFPGDRGNMNNEAALDMNSDMNSLIENQVPQFPGGPLRTMHPRFAMRSPGRHMRPRGPPPYGPNMNFVDFPPFPGPRHRGEFGGRGGRGRGFGGRGDHGHRLRPSVDNMID